MKLLFLCAGLALTAATAAGQPADTPAAGNPPPVAGTPGDERPGGDLPVPTVSPELQKERDALVEARGLLKTNNLAAVERALASANRSRPATADYHIETAERLVQVAEVSLREGEKEGVPAVAQRALQQLQQAEALATTVDARIAAKTRSGFIQERYLADPAAAIASYQAAARLSPERAGRAAEAAERLKRTEENLRNLLEASRAR